MNSPPPFIKFVATLIWFKEEEDKESSRTASRQSNKSNEKVLITFLDPFINYLLKKDILY